MKKIIALFFLISLVNNWAFGFDGDSDDEASRVISGVLVTIDFDVGFLLGRDNRLTPSFGFGASYGCLVIPNIFVPGIYFGVLSNSLLKVGLNNVFSFGQFDIQPFIGSSFLIRSEDVIGFTTIGALLAYNCFGIKYNYHLPFKNVKNDRHYVSIIFRLKIPYYF